MPNWVMRPADGPETAEAWRAALRRADGPTALALSRQELPPIDRTRYASAAGLHRGAYVLAEASGGEPELILLATGSEVWLALAAQDELEHRQDPHPCGAMPCWELFEAQDQDYQDQVLPPPVTARLAVEAGGTALWRQWVGLRGGVVGIDRFGASAPGGTALIKFGFTEDNVVERALAVLHRPTSRRRACCGTCRPERPRRSAMTTTNPLAQLSDQGVSVWVDSIARDWLEKGELRRLRDDFSVVGVTSNPTIFEAAIGAGGFYATSGRPGRAGLGRGALRAPGPVLHPLCRPDLDRCTGDRGPDCPVLRGAPDLAHDTRDLLQAARLFDLLRRPTDDQDPARWRAGGHPGLDRVRGHVNAPSSSHGPLREVSRVPVRVDELAAHAAP